MDDHRGIRDRNVTTGGRLRAIDVVPIVPKRSATRDPFIMDLPLVPLARNPSGAPPTTMHGHGLVHFLVRVAGRGSVGRVGHHP